MVNFLDIIIVAALAFFLIRGIFRGFFLEAASIAGVVLAVYLAGTYSADLAPFFERWIKSPSLMSMLAYGVIFVGVMAGVSILARLVSAILGISPVPWLSYAGGAVLGLGKGLALSLVALSTITSYAPEAGFLQESTAAKYLKPATESVSELLPGSGGFDPETLKQQIQQNGHKALEDFLGSEPTQNNEQPPEEPSGSE
jgi:membrane protein required for colicin V production